MYICVKQVSWRLHATKSEGGPGPERVWQTKTIWGRRKEEMQRVGCFRAVQFAGFIGRREFGNGMVGKAVRPSGTGHRTAKRLQRRWCSVWDVEIGFSDESLKLGGKLGRRAGSRQGRHILPNCMERRRPAGR